MLVSLYGVLEAGTLNQASSPTQMSLRSQPGIGSRHQSGVARRIGDRQLFGLQSEVLAL